MCGNISREKKGLLTLVNSESMDDDGDIRGDISLSYPLQEDALNDT